MNNENMVEQEKYSFFQKNTKYSPIPYINPCTLVPLYR